jgi:flagellar biosynthesis/type III secretory pathway M-ring protein FliF/YscJ
VEDPIALDTPAGADGLPAPDTPLLPTAAASAQQHRTNQLENIRQLSRQNPATVANVVRNWVNA